MDYWYVCRLLASEVGMQSLEMIALRIAGDAGSGLAREETMHEMPL